MFARGWITLGLVLLGVSGGCTSQQLRLSTTRQARTLAETQYEQVLNNLAMTCLDPSVLPSLVSLKTGSTQIGDTGTIGFLGTAGLDTKFGASPTVSGSRSIVDQWGNVPVTDDNELKILRRAFRTARGIPDLLSEEEATDLGHDLAQQIGTNSDISCADINLQRIFDVKVRVAFDNYKAATAPPVPDTAVKSATPPAPPAPEVPAVPAIPGTEESTTYGPPRRTFDLETQTLFDSDNPLWQQMDAFFAAAYVDTLQEDFLDCDPKKPPLFIVKGQFDTPRTPATSLAVETVRRVNDIQKELVHVASLGNTWYHVGCKKECPEDACYVGRARACSRRCGHRFCGDEIYVWVCPDGRAALAELTLSVIKLSGMFRDTQVVTTPSGIQYSPTFSSPSR